MGLEIERKFLVKKMPEDLTSYECHTLMQGYLCTSPVVRVRRENSSYYLTYKGSGLLARKEYNLPLDEVSFSHLIKKADGNIISKSRYLIPYQDSGKTYTIELDIFHPPFEPLIIAEVEFGDESEASLFTPPDWFGKEVTYDPAYHNSNLSRKKFPDIQNC